MLKSLLQGRNIGKFVSDALKNFCRGIQENIPHKKLALKSWERIGPFHFSHENLTMDINMPTNIIALPKDQWPFNREQFSLDVTGYKQEFFVSLQILFCWKPSKKGSTVFTCRLENVFIQRSKPSSL